MNSSYLMLGFVFILGLLIGFSFAQYGGEYGSTSGASASTSVPTTTSISASGNGIAINGMSGNGVSGNAIVVYPPITTNASPNVIMAANAYVTSRLTWQYFTKYISLNSALTYTYKDGTNQSVISYSYKIPYINGNTTAGIGQALGGAAAIWLLGVDVMIVNGNVVSYVGPSLPFVINLSRSQAIGFASAFGLPNVTNAYITATNPFVRGNNTGYSVVWAVVSGSRVYQKANFWVYPGVYVNITSGKVLGEFVVNPFITGALQSGGNGTAYQPTGSTGNFSMFALSPTNSSAQSSPEPQLLFVGNFLWIGAAVVILIMLYFALTARKARK